MPQFSFVSLPSVLMIFCCTCAYAWQQDTASLDENFRKAEQLELSGKYEEALHLFEQVSVAYKALGDWKHYIIALGKVGKNHYLMAQYDEAVQVCQKAIAVADQYLGERKNEVISPIYIYLGDCYGERGDYDRNLDYLYKALQALKSVGGEEQYDVAECYMSIALCYGLKGNFLKELSYLEKALNIYIHTVGDEHPDVANCHSNISFCYWNMGEYKKQYHHALKSLHIRQKVLPENHPYLAISYNMLGLYYGSQEVYDQQLAYIKKALHQVRKAFGKNHIAVATYYFNLGKAYADAGDYQIALDNTQEAIGIWRHLFDETHPKIATCYYQMGEYYGKMQDTDRQKYYYDTSLAIRKKAFQHKHPAIAESYNALGRWYAHQNQWEKALEQYQQALVALVENFNDHDIYTNPSLQNINARLTLLDVLKNKALAFEAMYDLKGRDIDYLKSSWKTLGLSVDLIDTLRLKPAFSISDQVSLDQMSFVFESAIRVAKKLFDITQHKEYLEKAFVYAEKSKAFTLLQSIQDSRAKVFAGIPDSLIQYEQNLKADLAYYEKKLYDAQSGETRSGGNGQEDQKQVGDYEKAFLKKQQEYELYIKRLEQQFPEYYQLKYNHEVISSREAIDLLIKPEQGLLEYFIGDSSVYVFCLTKQGVFLYEHQQIGEVIHYVDILRNSIDHYAYVLDSAEQVKRAYLQAAYHLYQILIEPAVSSSQVSLQRLLIVPSQVLGYLNFEILLTDLPVDQVSARFKNLPYLLKKYEIAYSYSATLLSLYHQKKKQADKAAYTFGGFAPDYQAQMIKDTTAEAYQYVDWLVRAGEWDLPEAKMEVQEIADLTQGKAWTAATEQDFKVHAQSCHILHFSGHSLLDDQNPAYSNLIFTPGKDTVNDHYLYAAEIYNLQLNAELTVLSACNTGFGEIKEGEGVMSLSRAFAYAGCHSLVMSLWKVPDEATKQLMVSFYENLLEGQDKSTALRNAKIHYLQHTEDPLRTHPYFWAGFIPVGKMDPVSFAPTYSVNIIANAVILLLLLGGGILFFIKRGL